MRLHGFADLLDRLYEAAAEEQEWEIFVRSLEAQLEDAVALFVRLPRKGDPGVSIAPAIDPGFLKAYEERFFGFDPAVCSAAALSEGAVEVVSRRRRGDPCAEIFFRDWLAPQGLSSGPSLVALIERRSDASAAALVTFPRVGSSKPTRAKQRLLSTVVLHLRFALRLYIRSHELRLERDALGASLDRFRMGLALVDESGRLLGKNWAAGRILDLRDGLTLDDGVLHTWGSQAGEELRRACTRATRGVFSQLHLMSFLSLPRPSGLAPLAIAVTPARSQGDVPVLIPSLAALFISDPAAGVNPSAEMLHRLFGLTPGQAALTSELVQGRSLEEAAPRLGVTLETARARLKQIFLRTDTHRQAELMRLVLTSPTHVLRHE
jgi:DNA-binding CsgD family transcriptional regulator